MYTTKSYEGIILKDCDDLFSLLEYSKGKQVKILVYNWIFEQTTTLYISGLDLAKLDPYIFTIDILKQQKIISSDPLYSKESQVEAILDTAYTNWISKDTIFENVENRTFNYTDVLNDTIKLVVPLRITNNMQIYVLMSLISGTSFLVLLPIVLYLKYCTYSGKALDGQVPTKLATKLSLYITGTEDASTYNEFSQSLSLFGIQNITNPVAKAIIEADNYGNLLCIEDIPVSKQTDLLYDFQHIKTVGFFICKMDQKCQSYRIATNLHNIVNLKSAATYLCRHYIPNRSGILLDIRTLADSQILEIEPVLEEYGKSVIISFEQLLTTPSIKKLIHVGISIYIIESTNEPLENVLRAQDKIVHLVMRPLLVGVNYLVIYNYMNSLAGKPTKELSIKYSTEQDNRDDLLTKVKEGLTES